MLLVDLDAAVHAGALEMNKIAIPSVFDVEFFCQVLRQRVRSVLSFPEIHVMVGGNVDV